MHNFQLLLFFDDILSSFEFFLNFVGNFALFGEILCCNGIPHLGRLHLFWSSTYLTPFEFMDFW